MGQFDKINDEKEIVGDNVENTADLSVENNKQIAESTPALSAEELQVKEDVKVQNKIEIDNRIKELQQELTGKVESKEEYPKGHILNSNIIDRIAQLEAIDYKTLEFSQEKYDNYINDRNYVPIIEKNIKKLQDTISSGKRPRYSSSDLMFGVGGANRYVVTDNGVVRLARGGDVASGSLEYKDKLAQKAEELGIMVG